MQGTPVQTHKIGADQEQVCCEIARRAPPLKPQYFTITPNGDNTVNCSLYNTVSGTVAKARIHWLDELLIESMNLCRRVCTLQLFGLCNTQLSIWTLLLFAAVDSLLRSERIVRRIAITAGRRQLHIFLQGHRHAAEQRC